LLEVNGAGLTGDGAAVGAIEAFAGRVSEVQAISSTASSPLGGDFTLSFRGFRTAPLVFNASASAVEAALEALPSIGNVTVERRALGVPNAPEAWTQAPSWEYVRSYVLADLHSFEWLVTFTSHAGDLELLVPCCDSAHRFDGTQTLFADASEDARLSVRRVVRGTGDALGGTFRVVIDNETTVPVAADADAEAAAAGGTGPSPPPVNGRAAGKEDSAPPWPGCSSRKVQPSPGSEPWSAGEGATRGAGSALAGSRPRPASDIMRAMCEVSGGEAPRRPPSPPSLAHLPPTEAPRPASERSTVCRSGASHLESIPFDWRQTGIARPFSSKESRAASQSVCTASTRESRGPTKWSGTRPSRCS
jgi:hypothetical protein